MANSSSTSALLNDVCMPVHSHRHVFPATSRGGVSSGSGGCAGSAAPRAVVSAAANACDTVGTSNAGP